jgi:hypothetical protein
MFWCKQRRRVDCEVGKVPIALRTFNTLLWLALRRLIVDVKPAFTRLSCLPTHRCTLFASKHGEPQMHDDLSPQIQDAQRKMASASFDLVKTEA